MNKNLRLTLCLSSLLLIAGCGDISDQQHVDNAKKYLEDGDLKSALIELKSSLQQNPKNQEARIYLGQIYLQASNYAAAEKELRKAIELGADDNETLANLSQALLQLRKIDDVLNLKTDQLSKEEKGKVLAVQGLANLIQGKHKAAIELTDRALSLAADSAYVQVSRASVYMMSEKSFAKAREQLKKAFDIDEDYAPAWSLLGDIEANEKHLELALEAYTKSISQQPTNLSDRNKRVTINLLLNDLKKAQFDLDILKKKLPGNPGVHFSQGLVHLASNNLEDAKSAFDLALLDQNRYPLSAYYLALVNYLQGNIAQSETHAEQFFTAHPEHLPGRMLLAELKYSKQDYKGAEELLGPVLKGDNTDIGVLNILAKTYLKEGKTAEGIELLKSVVERNPDSADAKVRLGAGLLLGGHETEGFAQLDSAIKQGSENHQADIYRVLSHVRLKQTDKALKAANEFLNRTPDSEIPYNLLGMIYLAERNFKEAQQALEESWRIKPGNTDAGHNLAAIAIQNSAFEKAREYLQSVQSSHPDSLETLLKLAELDAIEGKAEQRVKHLEEAIRIHPNIVEPRLLLAKYFIHIGKPAQVTGLIETLDLEARKQPAVLEVLAYQELAQKKYAVAEKTAQQFVEMKPEVAQGYYLLAQAHVGRADLENGQRMLQKAVEKDARFLPARIALLRLLIKKRDIPAIEQEIAALKTFAADNQDVMKVEFALESLKGDQQRALQLAEKVFKAYPNIGNMLALSRQSLRVGDSERALKLREDWANSHTSDYEANLVLAETYTSLNKSDLAVKYYLKALEISPDNILVLNNLAWAMRHTDSAQALLYAKKANTLKPGTVTLMDTLALVYLANNNIEMALRTIKDVLFLEPNNPTLRFHEAMINVSAGKQTLAVEILKDLLGKEEDFPEKTEADALFKKLNEG